MPPFFTKIKIILYLHVPSKRKRLVETFQVVYILKMHAASVINVARIVCSLMLLYRYSSAIHLPSTSIQRLSRTHVFFFPSFFTSLRNKQGPRREGMNRHHYEP
jgi:hypothetical protein